MDTENSEEFLKRIEQERKEINEAYDKGFGIDSNEFDKIQVDASRIDRYGFIHAQSLPNDLTEVEKLSRNNELARVKKWLNMFENWNNYATQSKINDKLVNRVFKGIPNSMRPTAWYKLLDIDAQKKAQSGVYEKMKNLARKYSLDLRQIDLDINRTFRNNTMFKKRYCQKQAQLFNVLAAYSIYNTEVGYCQGMSGITALLLMYLADEESTFWALSELMANSKYSMHGMFKRDFPKLTRFSNKHDQIVQTMLPKLFKKLKKSNITSLLYTTKWFLQCYLDTLPFSLVLRIWDIYLLKGDSVILAMSYCILKTHKRKIKKMDMDSINQFLKNKLPEDFGLSDDIAISKLQECLDELKRNKLLDIESIPTDEQPTIPFGQFRINLQKPQQLGKKQTVDDLVESQLKRQPTLTESISSSSSIESIDDDDNDDNKVFEYDKESLASEIATNISNNSTPKVLQKHIKRYPSDYDNLNRAPLGVKTTIIVDCNKTNGPSIDKNVKQQIIRDDVYELKLDNNGLDTNEKSIMSKSFITTEKILNSNASYASMDKNVARIIVHKDNLEFIRGQYGIYTKDKSAESSLNSTLTSPNGRNRSSSLKTISRISLIPSKVTQPPTTTTTMVSKIAKSTITTTQNGQVKAKQHDEYYKYDYI